MSESDTCETLSHKDSAIIILNYGLFRIKHYEARICVHDVRLGEKSRLTGTGTTTYQHIQVSSVLSTIKPDCDILRENLVLCLILVSIFLVD